MVDLEWTKFILSGYQTSLEVDLLPRVNLVLEGIVRVVGVCINRSDISYKLRILQVLKFI